MKKVLISLTALLFFSFPKEAFANIYVNEFSSNSSPEWVELYNDSDSSVDLTGWSLKDDSQGPKSLSGTIDGKGYFVFENPAGWLNNNDGDSITLFNNASPSAQIDQVIYGKSGSVVSTPDPDKSAGRIPNGSSVWDNNLSPSKNGANPQVPTATPTPAESTPTPTANTPTPTSKPSPTPTKKPTPTPTSEPTPTQSEEQAAATEEVTPTITPEVLGTSSLDIPGLLPKVFIGTGLLLLFGAGAVLLLPKLKQYRYNRQHGEDSEVV